MSNQSNNISRLSFLKQLGFGGSALMAVYMSSCVNESVNPSIGGNTLDLNQSSNSSLLNVGGYVITGNIVVANLGGGKYAAVTKVCSHEGQQRVIYQNGEFYCTAHGARFDANGNGLNANGSKGLTTYAVSLNCSVLTIG